MDNDLFDKELKKIVNKDIYLSDIYKENIENAIDYCFNIDKSDYKKKYNKILKYLTGVAAVIMISLIGITTYAVTTGKLSLNLTNFEFLKLSKNYEENAQIVEKRIETDDLIIELQSVSGDNAYLIFQYKINLKENILSEIGTVEFDQRNGYRLGISGKSYINGKLNYGAEHIEKISDSEYLLIQTFAIMEKNTNQLDVVIWLDRLFKDFEGDINLGVINKEIHTTVDLNKVSNFEKQERVLDENQKIIITNIGNSQFETYISATIITEGLTYKEYDDKYMNFNWKNFVVTDENNKLLSTIVYDGNTAGKKIYKINNDAYEEVEFKDINYKKDKIKLEENYRILLEEVKDLSKIKVYLVSEHLFSGKQEIENYNNATWYPVIAGEQKYIAKSNLGGSLIINKIDIDENNITFYYEIEGIIGSDKGIVIRDKTRKLNYIHPSKLEVKAVSGKENIIQFAIHDNFRASTNGFREDLDEIIENLEFTMLFNKEYNFIGDCFECEIPALDKNIDLFNDFNIIDTKFNTIKGNITLDNGENKNYIIDVIYDDFDNLLDFDATHGEFETYKILKEDNKPIIINTGSVGYINGSQIQKYSKLKEYLKQYFKSFGGTYSEE